MKSIIKFLSNSVKKNKKIKIKRKQKPLIFTIIIIIIYFIIRTFRMRNGIESWFGNSDSSLYVLLFDSALSVSEALTYLLILATFLVLVNKMIDKWMK